MLRVDIMRLHEDTVTSVISAVVHTVAEPNRLTNKGTHITEHDIHDDKRPKIKQVNKTYLSMHSVMPLLKYGIVFLKL